MIYASVVVTPATVLKVEDRPAAGAYRKAAVKFDGLSIELGAAVITTDESIVAAGELLIAAVRQLVDAARARIEDANEREAEVQRKAAARCTHCGCARSDHASGPIGGECNNDGCVAFVDPEDGPPDSYWQAPDDSKYRAEMRDAGRGAQVA